MRTFKSRIVGLATALVLVVSGSWSQSVAAPLGEVTQYPLDSSNVDPMEIVTGPDGAAWFAPREANYIGRLLQNGTIETIEIPSRGRGLYRGLGTSAPFGIAVGPDRKIWFTEYYGNRIGRIEHDGEVVEFRVPTPDSTPTGLTAGPDGAMWFTEFNGDQIGRITMKGVVTEYPTSGGPTDITAGADGNLWFTRVFDDAIGRMTPEGNSLPPYPVPTHGSEPSRITAGPKGSIWFTELIGEKIGTIADGTLTELPIPNGRRPIGITVGPDANIWFGIQRDFVGRLGPENTFSEYPVRGGTLDVAPRPDGGISFTVPSGGFDPDSVGVVGTGDRGRHILVNAAGATPASAVARLGGVVEWMLLGPTQTSVRDVSRLDLFDSGRVGFVEFFSYTTEFAGRFPYVAAGRAATLGVRPRATLDGQERAVKIQWAVADPAGRVFDVQVRGPEDDRFEPWLVGTTEKGARYLISTSGEYAFRARMRAPGARRPGYSPPVRIDSALRFERR